MKTVINKNEIRAISKGFYESVFDLYKGHPFRKFFFTPEEAQISAIRKAKRQSNFFEIYFGFRTTDVEKQKQLEELVLNLSIVPTHPLEIMTFPNACIGAHCSYDQQMHRKLAPLRILACEDFFYIL